MPMSGNTCCSAQSSWKSHTELLLMKLIWADLWQAHQEEAREPTVIQSNAKPAYANALLVYVAAFLQALSCSSCFGHSLTPSQVHQADLADLLSRILHRWDMEEQQLRNTGMKHQHALQWHHETLLFFIIMWVKVSQSRDERSRNCQRSYWSLEVTHIFSSKGLKHQGTRISHVVTSILSWHSRPLKHASPSNS